MDLLALSFLSTRRSWLNPTSSISCNNNLNKDRSWKKRRREPSPMISIREYKLIARDLNWNCLSSPKRRVSILIKIRWGFQYLKHHILPCKREPVRDLVLVILQGYSIQSKRTWMTLPRNRRVFRLHTTCTITMSLNTIFLQIPTRNKLILSYIQQIKFWQSPYYKWLV